MDGWVKLSACRGEFEGFADAGEDVAFGDAAGVAFVDSSSECGEFGGVLMLSKNLLRIGLAEWRVEGHLFSDGTAAMGADLAATETVYKPTSRDEMWGIRRRRLTFGNQGLCDEFNIRHETILGHMLRMWSGKIIAGRSECTYDY